MSACCSRRVSYSGGWARGSQPRGICAESSRGPDRPPGTIIASCRYYLRPSANGLTPDKLPTQRISGNKGSRPRRFQRLPEYPLCAFAKPAKGFGRARKVKRAKRKSTTHFLGNVGRPSIYISVNVQYCCVSLVIAYLNPKAGATGGQAFVAFRIDAYLPRLEK